MSLWEQALRSPLLKLHYITSVTHSSHLFACGSRCRTLSFSSTESAFMLPCPTRKVTDTSSETISQPQINDLLDKSWCGHGVIHSNRKPKYDGRVTIQRAGKSLSF